MIRHYSSEFYSRQPDPYEVARMQMTDHVIEIAQDLKRPTYFSELIERQNQNPAHTFGATWASLDQIMPGPLINAASSRSAGILFGMAITRRAMGDEKIWDRDVAAQAERFRVMARQLPFNQVTDNILIRASRLLDLSEKGERIARPYISLLERISPYPPEAVYDPSDISDYPEANKREFLRSLGLTVFQSTEVLKIRHET